MSQETQQSTRLAEVISRGRYNKALAKFKEECPERAWGVTPNHFCGACYYFPQVDAYAVLWGYKTGETELSGVFRASDNKGPIANAAKHILEVLPRLGINRVALSCYAPLDEVWEDAGLFCESYTCESFDPKKAPDLWEPEYGRPDVWYLVGSIKQ